MPKQFQEEKSTRSNLLSNLIASGNGWLIAIHYLPWLLLTTAVVLIALLRSKMVEPCFKALVDTWVSSVKRVADSIASCTSAALYKALVQMG